MVESLLGGSSLNYVGHRELVCGASAGPRKERKYVELADIARQRSLRVDNIETASIGQRLMGNGLAPYPTALIARSCLRNNSGIIFTSDMG